MTVVHSDVSPEMKALFEALLDACQDHPTVTTEEAIGVIGRLVGAIASQCHASPAAVLDLVKLNFEDGLRDFGPPRPH